MSSDNIDHWRKLAEEYKQKYDDAKEELEEYQQSSQELEAEMEMQLDQAEKKLKESEIQRDRLQSELEALRDRFEDQHSTDIKQITEQQDELAQLRAYKEELEKYIRELEQNNDDLERAKRETVTSLQDFETKLNQAIERNAFLESELDDKDYLMESVQRLKDEARDLRQELDVTKKKKEETDAPVVKVKPEVKVEPSSSSNFMPYEQTQKEAPHHFETPSRSNSIRQTMSTTPGGTPLTPTARISALNIVGDLLRKVGALENKLNAVKNTVKDQSPMTKPRNLHLTGNGTANSKIRRPQSSKKSSSTTAQQGFVKIKV